MHREGLSEEAVFDSTLKDGEKLAVWWPGEEPARQGVEQVAQSRRFLPVWEGERKLKWLVSV